MLRLAIRLLAQHYGDVPAAELGPLKLKVRREETVRSGLARTMINGFVLRIRQAVHWAVEEPTSSSEAAVSATRGLRGPLAASILNRVNPTASKDYP